EVTVAVKRQVWGLAAGMELLQLSEDLLRQAVDLGVQPYLSQPGLWTADDQPVGRPRPLKAGKGQPEDRQQELLTPADLIALAVENCDVIVLPQLRGSVHPHQGVEAERQVFVLKDGVHQQQCSPLQGCGCEDCPPSGTAVVEAGDEPGDRL